MKFIFLSLIVLFVSSVCIGQTVRIAPDIRKETFTFVTRDTSALKLDVYTHPSIPKNSPCIIFVFGGGFFTGSRDQEFYNRYFNAMVGNKCVVVSISYRLGLKGAKKLSKFNVTPLRNAIGMAVEDLFDATNWVIKNAAKIGVDPAQIILSGSSAGAITVLQGDFEKRNSTPLGKHLPEDFQYAGVIAFAGAILSFDGKLKYKIPPAPTMMFHGTEDKLVYYNRIKFFNRSFNGSNYIASVFKKNDYPYYFYRVEKMGHEVSASPLHENLKDIAWFVDEFVRKKKYYQIEETFHDLKAKRTMILSSKDIYK